MVLTQLFIMGTGFIDTAMAGHYGAADLAGVALGGNLMWPLFFLAPASAWLWSQSHRNCMVLTGWAKSVISCAKVYGFV
ncbi:MAG: hypothetical protein CM15mP120_02000 [Pseudomonadota bacterium]|nr:MAG: hypothetical protein CM15mP120_02000 [Pseudomonadota bacterium]